MIRHIVLLRVPGNVQPSAIESVFSQLDALTTVVPGMLDFHVGTDITPVSLAQGFTHAFTIDFQDQASRDGYWEHPGHLAVAGQLLPLLPQGTDDMIIFQIPLATA